MKLSIPSFVGFTHHTTVPTSNKHEIQFERNKFVFTMHIASCCDVHTHTHVLCVLRCSEMRSSEKEKHIIHSSRKWFIQIVDGKPSRHQQLGLSYNTYSTGMMCSGLMFVFINIILQNFLWNKLVRYATATHIQRMKSVESFYVNGKLEKKYCFWRRLFNNRSCFSVKSTHCDDWVCEVPKIASSWKNM